MASATTVVSLIVYLFLTCTFTLPHSGRESQHTLNPMLQLLSGVTSFLFLVSSRTKTVTIKGSSQQMDPLDEFLSLASS